jgi:hypothetical protein
MKYTVAVDTISPNNICLHLTSHRNFSPIGTESCRSATGLIILLDIIHRLSVFKPSEEENRSNFRNVVFRKYLDDV